MVSGPDLTFSHDLRQIRLATPLAPRSVGVKAVKACLGVNRPFRSSVKAFEPGYDKTAKKRTFACSPRPLPPWGPRRLAGVPRRWCSIAAANLLRPCVGTQLLQLPSLCCHLPLPLPLRPVPRTPSSAPNLETSWPAKACSPDGFPARSGVRDTAIAICYSRALSRILMGHRAPLQPRRVRIYSKAGLSVFAHVGCLPPMRASFH